MKTARRDTSGLFSREKRIVFNDRGSWTANVVSMPASFIDAGFRHMDALREKARLVSGALQEADIPHAVIGGLALAAHVWRINEKLERVTQDIDILLDRKDLERAKKALDPIGYRYRKVMKLHAFMPKKRKALFVEGIHVIWAGEKVRDEYPHATPTLKTRPGYRAPDGVLYLDLVDLLTMKLTSFRMKDQVHIQDLIEQKLVNRKIEMALPKDLLARLQTIKQTIKRER